MGHLQNRNIIIGVTGGIAAYKIAETIRLLRKSGAAVRVIMSRGSQAFITPLTLQSLSGNPVHTDLLDETAEMGMGHIELARWADAYLIAPATADTLARLAMGRADDLLTTTALATPAPLFVAPAMNQQMWSNTATQANMRILEERGITVLGPGHGTQACGDIGAGRLAEPEEMSAALEDFFPSRELAGKRVVITAGPTLEAIDPVRFVSNHSSGKMGFALAQAAAEAGADTVLVAGPVTLATPPNVRRVDVQSAEEMLAACLAQLATPSHLFIGSAAVADYRPVVAANQKIKKSGESLQLELVRNPDIIAAVATMSPRPLKVIGFAAETEHMVDHAQAKRETKGLDVIVANDVSRKDIGFDSDTNAVTWIDGSGAEAIPMTSKKNLARILITRCAQLFAEGEDDDLPQTGRESGGIGH